MKEIYYEEINEACINSMSDWELLGTYNVLTLSGKNAWEVMLRWAKKPFLSD